MSPKAKHTLSGAERQATIQELLHEQMRMAIRHTFISVLEEEVNQFIQAALYQRTRERRDYRNGYYERDLVTTSGLISDLPVPRTREGFRTQLFERYQRRQAELAHVARLATLGETATGLAHELNPPLSAIHHYAHGCRRRLRDGNFDTEETLNVTEKIAAQIALAIENARLLEDSQRRAIREQTLNELTTRLSRSLDLENLLQNAVLELHKLPQVTDASVVIAPQEQRKQG